MSPCGDDCDEAYPGLEIDPEDDPADAPTDPLVLHRMVQSGDIRNRSWRIAWEGGQ